MIRLAGTPKFIHLYSLLTYLVEATLYSRPLRDSNTETLDRGSERYTHGLFTRRCYPNVFIFNICEHIFVKFSQVSGVNYFLYEKYLFSQTFHFPNWINYNIFNFCGLQFLITSSGWYTPMKYGGL